MTFEEQVEGKHPTHDVEHLVEEEEYHFMAVQKIVEEGEQCVLTFEEHVEEEYPTQDVEHLWRKKNIISWLFKKLWRRECNMSWLLNNNQQQMLL